MAWLAWDIGHVIMSSLFWFCLEPRCQPRKSGSCEIGSGEVGFIFCCCNSRNGTPVGILQATTGGVDGTDWVTLVNLVSSVPIDRADRKDA